MNGTDCTLLKQPLIQWDGGAEKSDCRAGIKSVNSLDVPSQDCACFKFSHMAVGWQSQVRAPPRVVPPAATAAQECISGSGTTWTRTCRRSSDATR